ncbi:hypothetical protein SAMN06265375_1161 [Muriicola jejuensis]|uniref:Uncharacterized protein n=1 Tax=Muriicola jejuensis TaxID=504488 RepID=A0A6P0UH09_9FLAO|nr:hypothetical protein [Muriicola jejuensis]NER11750.1 hypothetical protein [Muriicola jejuensis]SMP27713.1 hypothetical protein SAMN06265375_1161 [Muriicola jejuensis]
MSKPILGGIYRRSFFNELTERVEYAKTQRIVGFDEHEIFYDAQWSDLSWTFSGNFNRKAYFYRMSVKTFLSNAEQIGFQEITNEEFKHFRPDLPLRFARLKQITWSDLAEKGLNTLSPEFLKTTLPIPEIIIVPSGPKGGLKSGIKVSGKENLNFQFILETTLNSMDNPENYSPSGIGYFRLGWDKRIPSYYIGGYIDKAGFLID